jgi:hypothetical protein
MRILAPLCVTAALAFALLPAGRAADRAAALQQALGSTEPLYKAPAAAAIAAVKQCAAHDPAHAGVYVSLVLSSGRADADAIAPSVARAAILGLGGNPHPDDIAAVVAAAVKAAPSEVLDIVTATVKVSPRSAAPGIVRAAVANVPDPENMVTVNFQRRAERLAAIAGSDKQSDGKETDHKEVADGKSLAPQAKQLTLAEAIVQAALDADPGLSADTLTSAVDGGIASIVPPPPTPVFPPVPPIPPGTGPGFGGPGTVSP